MINKTFTWCLALVLCLPAGLGAQDIPESFLESLAKEKGHWVADNSAYQSDQEPFDHYVIMWNWAEDKKGLVGKLYGLQKAERSGVFWTFQKYWDPEQGVAVVSQKGMDGTVGEGPLHWLNDRESELVQHFTTPDGRQYVEGHRTRIIDGRTNVGSSFTIDSAGTWTKKRTYTWVRQ